MGDSLPKTSASASDELRFSKKKQIGERAGKKGRQLKAQKTKIDKEYVKKREAAIAVRMMLCKGRCEDCGASGPLQGHEPLFRSRGGNPLDPEQIIMICPKCHQERHGIKSR